MSTTVQNKVKLYDTFDAYINDTTVMRAQNDVWDPQVLEANDQKAKAVENHSSIILTVIKQLKPGMDLSRFQAPAFTLKPKSYLETTSDYVYPLDSMVKITHEADPEKRMITVVSWILTNMTITPQKGFSRMKPYNPILGEQFYCKWDHDDSTTFFYSEQVSHHPPISALYMENRKYNWVYTSTTAPKSTFWTNKVEMTIDGEHILHLLTLDEKYVIQWPVVVGRGVLIGTSMVEHNHNLVITCAKTGLKTNIEMIKKSNDFKGTISKGKEDVYKLTGAFETKGIAEHIKSKQQTQLFDAKNIQRTPKLVTNVADQKTNESRRVWHHVTAAMLNFDYDLANKLKHIVEEEQRKITKARHDKDEHWKPKEFFETDRKINDKANAYQFVNQNLNPSKEESASDLNLD